MVVGLPGGWVDTTTGDHRPAPPVYVMGPTVYVMGPGLHTLSPPLYTLPPPAIYVIAPSYIRYRTQVPFTVAEFYAIYIRYGPQLYTLWNPATYVTGPTVYVIAPTVYVIVPNQAKPKAPTMAQGCLVLGLGFGFW